MKELTHNSRWYLPGAAILLASAGAMWLIERPNQVPFSLLYTVVLPAVTVILAVVFYFQKPRRTSPERSYPMEPGLLLTSFFVTLGFWASILWTIHHTTPVGDVSGLLFLFTLLPGVFDFWWPGLALAVAPELGSGEEEGRDRRRYLFRLATGSLGGMLAGIPLYLFASWLPDTPILAL